MLNTNNQTSSYLSLHVHFHLQKQQQQEEQNTFVSAVSTQKANGHNARSAKVSTERPSITPAVRPMAPAPTTTATPTNLSDDDYHIHT
jgi:hypothetical protein